MSGQPLHRVILEEDIQADTPRGAANAFIELLDHRRRRGEKITVDVIPWDGDEAPEYDSGARENAFTFASPDREQDTWMHPLSIWSAAWSLQGRLEGWLLTNAPGQGDDIVTIARYDCPDDDDNPDVRESATRFDSDLDALMHVNRRALEGSPVHMLALLLVGHRVNEPLPPAMRALADRVGKFTT